MTATATRFRYRPILFSAAMVRQILADRKTQTRRLLDPQPPAETYRFIHTVTTDWWEPVARCREEGFTNPPTQTVWECPFGAVGDRLWVRENYSLSGFHQDDTGDDADLSDRPLVYCRYSADGAGREVRLTEAEGRKLAKRKTDRHRPLAGRFMYRSCSRITLVITGIRIERVSDISEADALSEGIEWFEAKAGQFPNIAAGTRVYRNYTNSGDPSRSGLLEPQASFESLWESLHEPEGHHAREAWPWVWVIDFRLVPSTPATA